MAVNLPSPVAKERETVSVADLTRMCNEAAAKMGVKNPNKLLMLTCATALQQLVQRLHDLEHPKVTLQ